MRIGVPKEIKVHEYRAGLTPESVLELTRRGHEVIVERGTGDGIGHSDRAYAEAGALLGTVEDAFAADLIVKVKEPQLIECARLSRGQTLFTYLHLAADPQQAEALVASGATAIAYETVTDGGRGLPLLMPMSEIAGRMSVQVGAVSLQKPNLGSGVLLGGVPGVAPGRVVVIGGGVAGSNAAMMALGLGADVTIIDRHMPTLRRLGDRFGSAAKLLFGTDAAIEEAVLNADLVIGAALVPGDAAPRLVTHDMVRSMRKGSVLVDISIDQGGCFETSRPTTHDDPTYVIDGVVHYCVANMPGAVPLTATQALNNATLPHVLALAELGCEGAVAADPQLAAGLNVADGQIVHPAVARALGEQRHEARHAAGSSRWRLVLAATSAAGRATGDRDTDRRSRRRHDHNRASGASKCIGS